MNNNRFSAVPVGPDYVLGPGDELILRVWGKIEQRLELVVDQSGKIYIPQIGSLALVGTTLSDAKTLIRREMEKKYVNFELSVTMGTLRAIKVFGIFVSIIRAKPHLRSNDTFGSRQPCSPP